MAGRGHVDVNERRLRPIYDALDNLNNKLAIQLADKILKKQKDLHCAKALKALALLRSNRVAECLELQEELKKSNVWDDSILQCMTMTYKEMQKPEEIAAIYELAVLQHQKNEEFLSHLFMAYVRIGSNLKQQKTAMNLHKSFPAKNPYYFWAVMSIYMQALTSEDEKAVQSMLLPLAERMVAKYVKENKIEAEAEVQLYLMILEKAGKHKEALDLLKDESEGSIGKLVNDKEQLMVKYLEKIENWSELHAMYKKLLEERPDQWSYYEGYLDTAFELMKKKCNPSEGEAEQRQLADFSLEALKEFLDNNLKANESLRGPYLGKLGLLKRMIEDGADCKEELLNQILVYFDKFGSRSCFFADASPYIDLLSEEQGIELVNLLAERLCQPPEDAPNSEKIKALQKLICTECIERRLGRHEHLSSKERLEKAKVLMAKHKHCIDYGKDFLPTDIQPVDVLALLAAYLLINHQDQQEANSMVWHGLLILEEASRHSPSNHEFKILKMAIYSNLGAFGPCLKMAEELEIKYIMLDTLGYKITGFAQSLCHFQSAASFYSATLKFFHANQKDTPEQIVSAYRYGAFRKIPEMIEFRDRLNTSVQFSLVLFEKRHLDLLQHGNSLEEARNIIKEGNLLFSCPSSASHFDGLMDNRDFNVLNYYDIPSRKPTKDQIRQSYKLEVLWIRYRCLFLRILGIAYKETEAPKNEHLTNGNESKIKDGSPEDLEAVVEQIRSIIENAKEINKLEEQYSTASAFHGPPRSRWKMVIEGKYYDPLLIAARILQSLQITSESSQAEANVKEQMKTLSNWFTETFKKCKENLVLQMLDKEMFNGAKLEEFSLMIEVSNYVTIIISLILEMMKRKQKKQKKKKGAQNVQAGSSLSVALEGFAKEQVNNLEDFKEELLELERKYISKELEAEALTDLFEKTQSDLVMSIWQSIQTSYKQSIQEVTQIIGLKIDYLRSLRS